MKCFFVHIAIGYDAQEKAQVFTIKFCKPVLFALRGQHGILNLIFPVWSLSHRTCELKFRLF